MRGRHSAWVIRIDEHTRATLQKWLRQQKTSLGLARRARTLLLIEQGLSYVSTARPLLASALLLDEPDRAVVQHLAKKALAYQRLL